MASEPEQPGLGRRHLKRYLACAGALTALAGSAHAASADSTDDSLTWYGITLYGTVDIGYTYQNRGTPLNDYFPTGLQYLIQPSMWSHVADGLAAGYLKSWTIDPTIGGRFNF
jgi:opacity protein-like surface antigen